MKFDLKWVRTGFSISGMGMVICYVLAEAVENDVFFGLMVFFMFGMAFFVMFSTCPHCNQWLSPRILFMKHCPHCGKELDVTE